MRFRSIKTSGNIEVDNDLIVGEDIAIGGDSSVTGDHTTSGDHTTTGNVIINGTLSATGAVTGTAIYAETTTTTSATELGAPDLTLKLVAIGKFVFAEVSFGGSIGLTTAGNTLTYNSAVPISLTPNYAPATDVTLPFTINYATSSTLSSITVTISSAGNMTFTRHDGDWPENSGTPLASVNGQSLGWTIGSISA